MTVGIGGGLSRGYRCCCVAALLAFALALSACGQVEGEHGDSASATTPRPAVTSSKAHKSKKVQRTEQKEDSVQGQSTNQSSGGGSGDAKGSSLGLGSRLDFGGSDLYYTSAVTASEAKRLRQDLYDLHTFDGAAGTFQITKNAQRYQFRMIVTPGSEKDQEFVFAMHALAMQISGTVFGGRQVEIDLCDETFRTVRVIDPYDGSSLDPQ
jgi:hypothetical protein